MPPNILLILTDDQRFDTIRALGNNAISTPNIDRLVARGCAFTQAHIPGGTVPAVCMPSRAMLHTGRTLFHLQNDGQQIPDDHITLGEHLRAQGYDTYGIGKWHNGKRAFNRSFSGGNEIFFGGMTDHWNVPAFRYDPSGEYNAKLPRCGDPFKSNALTLRSCDHIPAGVHSSTLFADAAIDFLANRDEADAPFFLYVSFLAPHDPRTMPQSFRDSYPADEVELPPNFRELHPFDFGGYFIRDEVLAGHPRKRAEIRQHIAEYYAMISHLDDEIGRMLDALEAYGLASETLIVFAGDNGLAVGQHGLMGKQNQYEHSIRVPLILSGPGIPEGVTRDARVYLSDIFPTLCQLLNIETPASVEGLSFHASIHDDTPARNAIYAAYSDCQRSIKIDNLKLIEYTVDGARTTQLFDLDSDPWELTSLAADRSFADDVKRLRKGMVAFRDKWDELDTKWGQAFWSAVEFDE